jgi:type II secretory pathway pseudopilin PulG
MRTRTKTFGCPSRNRRQPGSPAETFDRGFALLIVMMLAVVLLISLTAALPSVYTQGQREKEEELIFRGNQYARAIALFRRQFQRYPTSVKELLKTSGFRFLRHEFPDPMTKKGKWRFIHASANGTPLDSLTLARPTVAKPLSGGSFGSEKKPATTTTEEGKESGEKSAFFGEGKDVQGAFIIGVASTSKKKSIRLWNNKSHYNEWEFLGVELNPTGAVPAQGVQPQGAGQMNRPPSSFPGSRPGGLPGLPPLTDRSNQ